MRKTLTLIMTMVLCLSLAACGKKEEAADTKPAVTEKETTEKETTEKETAEKPSEPVAEKEEAPGGASPEEQAALDEYNKMVDRYNVVADQINADENLVSITEVVNTTNMVADALNEVTTMLDSTETLAAEDITNLEIVTADSNIFLDEMEAMIKNYGGKTVVTIQAELTNDTGADLYGFTMSPTTDESWGGNLLTEPLKQGEAGVTEMSITEDSLTWDFLAMDGEGSTLVFSGVDFSGVDIEAGAKILLSVSETGEYVATVE